MDHPIPETLTRFATGNATRQENRMVVAHLLKGCAHCARQIREGARPEVRHEAYDGVLTHLTGGSVRPPGTWAKLLPFEKAAPSVPALPLRSVASR